jgi:hypothetical protein
MDIEELERRLTELEKRYAESQELYILNLRSDVRRLVELELKVRALEGGTTYPNGTE